MREIEHGSWLAHNNTETVWGWGTPAGRLRAKRRAQLIAQGAGLGPGVTALEIGCGTGLFTELLAATGARITAVDLSPDLLKKAQERNLPAEQVRFLLRPFEKCMDLGPFDAVLGSSVLHHLDLDPALGRIAELLKPGGLMSFAEPNMLNPQVFAERHFRFLFPQVSPDETAFIRWRLAAGLSRANFHAIEITPFDWLHPSVPSRFIAPVLRLGRLLEILPGLREFSGSLYIRARKS